MKYLTSNSYLMIQNMPLFGSSKKNPVEIIKIVRDAFTVLDKDERNKKSEKVTSGTLVKSSCTKN